MREFAELFHDLDGMTKTGDRIDRMSAYFRDADPKDADGRHGFLPATGSSEWCEPEN